MSLSLAEIEATLRSMFRQQVVDRGIQQDIRFLRRWLYLSSQVPRLHGAALARIRIPAVQSLIAEIAHGECGSGDRSQIHSTLLIDLMAQAPCADYLISGADPTRADQDLVTRFEETVTTLCQLSQDEAIGFIVGLEAPAYDILKLLQRSLGVVGIAEQTIATSAYMVIHEAVEKEHQESGHEAMQLVLNSGCDRNHILQGGICAVQFLIDLVGEQPSEGTESSIAAAALSPVESLPELACR